MRRPTLDAVCGSVRTMVVTVAGEGASPGRRRASCLVAVDGTQSGVDALVWGLRHAADRDMDVEVLTVWPPHRSVLVHEVPGHFCAPRWTARAAQEDTVRRAIEAVGPAPAVSSTLENGDAAEAIVRASARHDLVVLGSSPGPGAHRLTERIVQDVACDVVVVASPPTDTHDDRGPATSSHRAAPHRQGAAS